MHFTILTIYPEMFPGYLQYSLLGKALAKGIWGLNIINIRDFAEDKHRNVDDKLYGGGVGLLMRPDVVGRSIEAALAFYKNDAEILYMSPRGKKLEQSTVNNLSSKKGNLIILCGRFEGIDQRVLDVYNVTEVSIGDYVISGGELAAYVLVDSCVRVLPGVVGNEDSLIFESFSHDMKGMLEFPQYTRPADWKGMKVPDVLLSGHHKNIDDWRMEQTIKLTSERRGDLLESNE